MAEEGIIPPDRIRGRAVGPDHPGYIQHCASEALPPGWRWYTGRFGPFRRNDGQEVVLHGHALVRDEVPA